MTKRDSIINKHIRKKKNTSKRSEAFINVCAFLLTPGKYFPCFRS
uniref:Uncharacterized protein n=1 Tax=Anguilla anguilla TaxID=7936 RepID=A0A0E9QST8_ANGAN